MSCIQKQSQAMMDEREFELIRLRRELTESLITTQEKEGSAIHWKLQFENKSRELKDLEEKHQMTLKGKNGTS